ncbi:hypothetical protein QAD02_008414 [Eretmocerus hayati]|uniref:Uncharacterized protein n=1 Tax=Eretmocerus hayati TaxID=131215 RepID=A0ACC2N6G3_9HYME|nr:hypothetical protein QAD02_008414 [Eretmocerus hayati]
MVISLNTNSIHPRLMGKHPGIIINIQFMMELVTAIEDLGDYRTIKILIHNGFDVNSRNERGITCLEAAISRGGPEIVELLLSHGADLDVRTSPMTGCLAEVMFRMLHVHDVNSESKKAIFQLLIAHGVKLDLLVGYPLIPLTLLQVISCDLLQLLLDAGMQVHSYYEDDGLLATFSVLRYDDYTVLQHLVSNNLINLSERDADGRTLLMFEASWNNSYGIQQLLDHGGNPDDFNGPESALSLATSDEDITDSFKLLFPQCNSLHICFAFGVAVTSHRNNHVAYITKELAFWCIRFPHPASIELSNHFGVIFTHLFNEYLFELQNVLSQEFCGEISWSDILLTKNIETLLNNNVLCDHVTGTMRSIPMCRHFWMDLYEKIGSIRRMFITKKEAQLRLCQIMNFEGNPYPHIIAQILNYLEYEDFQNLKDVYPSL